MRKTNKRKCMTVSGITWWNKNDKKVVTARECVTLKKKEGTQNIIIKLP